MLNNIEGREIGRLTGEEVLKISTPQAEYHFRYCANIESYPLGTFPYQVERIDLASGEIERGGANNGSIFDSALLAIQRELKEGLVKGIAEAYGH